jgi:hypothetical protein
MNLNLQKNLTTFFIAPTAISITAFLSKKRDPTNKKSSILEDLLLMGNWAGESICQVKNSACKDETVVYHITRKKNPALFQINADKIVNGSSIQMGELEFRYNKLNHTLICESNNGFWKLTVTGKRIEGSLTFSDKTFYRKILLKKIE